MSSDSGAAAYDIQRILKALPHRYPLLLVDRVRTIELGERIHAVKAVTMNEEFFQGHFPGAPIMPGVLQIDSKLKITPGQNSIQVKGRVRIKLPSEDAPVADFRFDWDFDT